MSKNSRKIVLVGTGLVGMSYAYAILNQSVCDELVLIDIDKNKALGEEMDLNHGLAFASSNMKIYAGEYSDCYDADIVVICAGVAQKPGESRLDLLSKNAKVFESIITPVVKSGFSGIFLVATNPVDIMTKITCVISGFPPSRVIGTGTSLDTARLRYLIGEYFTVDPRNIHAYVIGEHGDTEFVAWSQSFMGTKPIKEFIAQSNGRFSLSELDNISQNVRLAASKIIDAKKATYYGIGMALVRITKAILGDENSILTISARLNENGVFAGMPCIVNANGVQEVISLSLSDDERQMLENSCHTLENCYNELKL